MINNNFLPKKKKKLLGKQGLQDKIELVAIDLEDRPAWYKEKVYPPNKVRFFLQVPSPTSSVFIVDSFVNRYAGAIIGT